MTASRDEGAVQVPTCRRTTMRLMKTAAVGLVMTLALAGGALAQVAKAAPAALDASLLKLGTATYEFTINGNPGGSSTTTVSKEAGVLVIKQTMESPMFGVQGESQMKLPELTSLMMKQTMTGGESAMVTAVKLENGKLTGSANLPAEMGGDRTFDLAAPEGTLLPQHAVVRLSLMPLAVGDAVTLNVFSAQANAIQPQTWKVTAEEKVTVPAGTFDTYKLEVAEGEQAGTSWVMKAVPHVMVKQEMSAFPVVIVAKTLP